MDHPLKSTEHQFNQRLDRTQFSPFCNTKFHPSMNSATSVETQVLYLYPKVMRGETDPYLFSKLDLWKRHLMPKHIVILLSAPESNQPARAPETVPFCLPAWGENGCSVWKVLAITMF